MIDKIISPDKSPHMFVEFFLASSAWRRVFAWAGAVFILAASLAATLVTAWLNGCTGPGLKPRTRTHTSSFPLAHQSRVRAPPWEAASWEGGRDAGGHGHHVRRVGGSGKSVSQPAGQPVRQSASQSVSPSVRQSARQSVSQSVGRSVGRSVSQPVSHPVSQSIGQSIVMHEGIGSVSRS